MQNIVIIILFAILTLAGCKSQTQKINNESLDVEISQDPISPEADQTFDPRVEPAQLKNDSNGQDNRLSKEVLYDWNLFFKKSPSTQESKDLSKQLELETSLDFDGYMKQGANALSLLNLDAAKKSYLNALNHRPNNHHALLQLAVTFLSSQKIDDTFNVLSKLKSEIEYQEIRDKSFLFRYRYVLAISYAQSQFKKRGRKILRELINLEKQFTPGYTALATSYLNEKKYPISRFILEQGLQRCGEKASLYSLLGDLHLRLNLPLRAEEYLNKALKLDSNHIPTYLSLAKMWYKRGNLTSSLMQVKKALHISPQSSYLLSMHGIVLASLKKEKEAKQSLERAIELDPNNSEARYNLGLISLFADSDPNQALQMFNEVQQLSTVGSSINLRSATMINDIKFNMDIL